MSSSLSNASSHSIIPGGNSHVLLLQDPYCDFGLLVGLML